MATHFECSLVFLQFRESHIMFLDLIAHVLRERRHVDHSIFGVACKPP